ncbi:hypothetical protein HanPSC8_Chr15g0680571 [Helianthus annuus]|nr:hypothetical protein HanPSC8_Chr15g0680571 [Helianthus annuus]
MNKRNQATSVSIQVSPQKILRLGPVTATINLKVRGHCCKKL